MLVTLIYIPIVTLIIININLLIFKNVELYKSFKFIGVSFDKLIKIINILSINITLSYSLYIWIKYPTLNNLYPSNSWMEGYNILNMPLVILSIFILLISILTIWYMNVNINLICIIILFLEICLTGAFLCNNILIFLFLFEASSIPIYILILYCGSDRRERLKSAYYFMFFTLYGSISLLLAIINNFGVEQIELFMDINSENLTKIIWLLLFITFAVKIPLFPVHVWLPYAHVEASTATSILLAAIMLKLGGYGMIKFMIASLNININIYFRNFAIWICIIGCVYGSLVAIRQIDLKRQIAFTSIAHMSFSTIGIWTLNDTGIKGMVYLMLSHGLTSAILFYKIGIISSRYHTRSVLAISGLSASMPIFSSIFLFASMANVGFPGTSGFIPEFIIITAAIKAIPLITIFLIFGMVLTTAGSFLVLLRILFGNNKYIINIDITKLEMIICLIIIIPIIIIGLLDILDSSI